MLNSQLNETELKLSKIQHEHEESKIKIKTNTKKFDDLNLNITKLTGYKIQIRVYAK